MPPRSFSLVHPSRQRVAMAEQAFIEWRSHASGRYGIEHILSIDAGDPDLEGYRALAQRLGSRLVVADNRSMVEALNRGAAEATGDVVIAIADDFGCPQHWDAALADVIGDRLEAGVLVNDGLSARIMTLPVLTRALHQRLGYVYHPAYMSMYADDDLTEVLRRGGLLIDARDRLVFPHRHASVSLGPDDDTHRRQNSGRSWWHGWRVFSHRGVDGFGPPRRDFAARLAHARIDAYYYARTGGAALRRWWLPLLPAVVRRAEARLRGAVLRAAARLTSQRVSE